MTNKMGVQGGCVGVMETAMWEIGLAPQQWPVILRGGKKKIDGKFFVKRKL